jgi:GNAT superfamily N-acetyltransferase
MAEELIIVRLDGLRLDRFAEMLAESEASGYRFLRRVANEWESGVNRFPRTDEALLVAEMDGRWVGICGPSIDPYLQDPRIGRLRDVYVLADCRRNGIGRRLVKEVIARARGTFDRLRLRSQEEGPARLFESLGFRPCRGIPDYTQILECPAPDPFDRARPPVATAPVSQVRRYSGSPAHSILLPNSRRQPISSNLAETGGLANGRSCSSGGPDELADIIESAGEPG